MDIEYSIKQTVGSGMGTTYQGYLRWTTTNTGESEFGTGSTEGTTGRFRIGTFDSGDGVNFSVKYDMAGHKLRDWDDRIITGIRFELLQIADTSGPATIVTDIDNIKISATTTQ